MSDKHSQMYQTKRMSLVRSKQYLLIHTQIFDTYHNNHTKRTSSSRLSILLVSEGHVVASRSSLGGKVVHRAAAG